MKEKKADTSAHSSGAEIALSTYVKKALDELRGMSDKQEELSLIERVSSDGPKVGVIDTTARLLKVEELLRINHSKEVMALAEVSTLHA